MIVENAKVYGIEKSIRVSKYPMSVDVNDCTCDLTDTQKRLAKSLCGSGEDNFLKGIIVQFDLTFTIKAWLEAERYNWFDIVSSQSTMHRIAKMDYEKSMISYVTENTKREMERIRNEYNADKTKDNYLKLLYNCPVGLRLTAGITTNYLQLKTIYRQRNNHRLQEWREFCEWIRELPLAELIVP